MSSTYLLPPTIITFVTTDISGHSKKQSGSIQYINLRRYGRRNPSDQKPPGPCSSTHLRRLRVRLAESESRTLAGHRRDLWGLVDNDSSSRRRQCGEDWSCIRTFDSASTWKYLSGWTPGLRKQCWHSHARALGTSAGDTLHRVTRYPHSWLRASSQSFWSGIRASQHRRCVLCHYSYSLGASDWLASCVDFDIYNDLVRHDYHDGDYCGSSVLRRHAGKVCGFFITKSSRILRFLRSTGKSNRNCRRISRAC